MKKSTTILLGVVLAGTLNPLYAQLPQSCSGDACGGRSFLGRGQATTSVIDQQLNINQLTDRATFNWQSFNIGPDNSVRFLQPDKNSVALNRIFDQRPSLIEGSLSANGRIYLINQNGVIFASGSQVDVQSLIASTLNMSDEVFASGLTQAILEGKAAFAIDGYNGDGEPGAVIVADGAEITAGTFGRILLIAPQVLNAGKLSADQGQVALVGAEDKVYLTAADSSLSNKLRGLLVEVQTGGTVTNIGEILTEQGNTTLIGRAVNQDGIIRATTAVGSNGSIRLLARDDAIVTSSAGADPVAVGQADLESAMLAIARRTGQVRVGKHSVTEVVPHQSDDTAIDEQEQLPSLIEIMGRDIAIEGDVDQGALLRATGGEVSLIATANPLERPLPSLDDETLLGQEAANLQQQVESGELASLPEPINITVSEGAVIDVSGTTQTSLPMSRHQYEVTLTTNFLRDAPVQRDGTLKGYTVRVDDRFGTPLAPRSASHPEGGDISEVTAATRRDVVERLAKGGSVNIWSRGDVRIEEGATINIAGGEIAYEPGFVTTSQLYNATDVVNVADANPQIAWQGVVGQYHRDYDRWGVSVSAENPLAQQRIFYAGYREGQDAGKLSIASSGTVKLLGRIEARTTVGDYQHQRSEQSGEPRKGALDLSLYTSNHNLIIDKALDVQPQRLDDAHTYLDQNAFEDQDLQRVSFDLRRGDFRVMPGTEVPLPAGSDFSVAASNVYVDGHINAAQSDIALRSDQMQALNASLPELPEGVERTVGVIQLGEYGSIDVSGKWLNEQGQELTRAAPTPFIDAGSVTLDAEGDLLLVQGSQIRANGGGWLQTDGSLKAGRGGDVSLISRREEGSQLLLNGELSAYSLAQSGELHIETGAIDIYAEDAGLQAWQDALQSGTSDTAAFKASVSQGGSLSYGGVQLSSGGEILINGSNDIIVEHSNGIVTIRPGYVLLPVGSELLEALSGNDAQQLQDASYLPLVLRPGFFRSGGFSRFSLSANRGDLVVHENADIAIRPDSFLFTDAVAALPSGGDLQQVAALGQLPDYLNPNRSALVLQQNQRANLSLQDSQLRIEAGSRISVTPGGDITLQSGGRQFVNGELNAPGGSITLVNEAPESRFAENYRLDQGLWLGSDSHLNVDAHFVLQPVDEQQRQFGDRYDAGRIILDSQRGYLVTERGSELSADGTGRLLNITPYSARDPDNKQAQVVAAAGSIALSAAEAMILEGDMHARGADDSTSGGDLSVIFNPENRRLDTDAVDKDSDPLAYTVRQMNLLAERPDILCDTRQPLLALAGLRELADSDPALPLNYGDAIADELRGQGFVSEQQLETGGFANVSISVDQTRVADTSTRRPGKIAIQNATDLVVPNQLELLASHFSVIEQGEPNQAQQDARAREDSLLAGQLPVEDESAAATTDNEDSTEAPTGPAYAGSASLAANVLRIGMPEKRIAFSGQESPGYAELSLKGNFVELLGSIQTEGVDVLNVLSQGDLRLTGARSDVNQQTEIPGRLGVDGTLNIRAQQIYPATLSRYQLAASELINIESAAGEPGQVLSAGGLLALESRNIRVASRITVPFGHITLSADESILLDDGGRLSVSGDGSVVPYGEVQSSLDWVLGLSGQVNLLQTDAPDKRVSMDAANILLQSGSEIDIRGGGDLYAYEWIKGLGGSVDILDPAFANGSFAIVPAYTNAYQPYDPLLFEGTTVPIGKSIVLDSNPWVPAGRYVVLPARYALLPGAALLSPLAGTDYIAADTVSEIASGYRTLSARLLQYGAGSAPLERRAYRFEDASQVRQRAEYDDYFASYYFPAYAQANETALAELPLDGGRLVLRGERSLALQGDIRAEAQAQGRGGLLDIATDNLRVSEQFSAQNQQNVERAETLVRSAGDEAYFDQLAAILGAEQASGQDDQQQQAFVEILAGTLNDLQVDSVLLGGERTDSRRERDQRGRQQQLTDIDISSDQVLVDEGVTLSFPELLLVARDRVQIDQHAAMSASGDSEDRITQQLNLAGDAAVVGLSASSRLEVLRSNPAAETGSVVVSEGANLRSDYSIVLDASLDNTLLGELLLNHGALSLGAARITVASSDEAGQQGADQGLVLDNSLLENLDVETLHLNAAREVVLAGGAGIAADEIIIDSPALRGDNGGGDTRSSLLADQLELRNSAQAVAAAETQGQGQLDIVTRALVFGGGSQTILGYDTVNMVASEQVRVEGDEQLSRISGDLTIDTPSYLANSGVRQSIDVTGHLTLQNSTDAAALEEQQQSLGAALDFRAASIKVDTQVVARAGQIALAAGDELELGAKALLDVRGWSARYGDELVYADAGRVLAEAREGELRLQAGSRIDVSADASAGAAGSISLVGAKGLRLDGELVGHAARPGEGGHFALRSSELQDFNQLSDSLGAGGFDGAWDIRLRDGNISVSEGRTIRARQLQLATDHGAISIGGTLDASGEQAGEIRLLADGDIVLAQSAVLDTRASAADERGGQIYLGSRDGTLSLRRGSELRVGGTREALDVATGMPLAGDLRTGSVHIRTRRIGDGLAINDFSAVISGADDIRLEGYRRYDLAEAAVQGEVQRKAASDADELDEYRIGGNFLARLKQESLDFLAHAKDLATVYAAQLMGGEGNAPGPGSPPVRVLAGIELSADGHVIMEEGIDFADGWQVDGAVGVLSLRAAGDVAITRPISDGFGTREGVLDFVEPDRPDLCPEYCLSNDPLQGSSLPVAEYESLLGGESWSYVLSAGADLDAVDTRAVRSLEQADYGDLVIGSEALIRSGSGDIDLAAGRDMILQGNKSVVYTAGTPTGRGNLPSGFANFYFNVDYPEHGGDIRVSAQRDVRGSVSGQSIGEWLHRMGTYGEGGDAIMPTAWGISFAYYLDSPFSALGISEEVPEQKFQQGFALFGGGKLAISAGRDVVNASVMVPSTGKQIGRRALVAGSDTEQQSANAPLAPFTENIVELHGGGDFSVLAGGDVLGGSYYIDRGRATITAGGRFAAGNSSDLNPVLFLANSPEFAVQAADDIVIETALNPSVLAISPRQNEEAFVQVAPQEFDNYFYSYGENAALRLKSVGGDIELINNAARLQSTFDNPNIGRTNSDEALTVYPGIVDLQSLQGDISINDSFTLFPGQSSQLNILAGDSILAKGLAGALVDIYMPDIDSSQLAGVLNPLADYFSTAGNLEAKNRNDGNFVRAPTPVHSELGQRNNIIAHSGNIASHADTRQSRFRMLFSNETLVMAGQDIRSLWLEVQHAHPEHQTMLIAGRDIVYVTPRTKTGKIGIDQARIDVSGPGSLSLLAGRDIDLGSSSGVTTSGNNLNSVLPDRGADIYALAGIGGSTLQVQRFVDLYRNASAQAIIASGLVDDVLLRQLTVDNPQLNADELELLAAEQQATLMKQRYQDTLIELIDSFSGSDARARFVDEELQQLVQQQGVASLADLDPNLVAGSRLSAGQKFDAFSPEQRDELSRSMAEDDYAQLQSDSDFALAVRLLFTELRFAGVRFSRDDVSPKLGYDTISHFFSPEFVDGKPLPLDDSFRSGDIKLVFSRIHTIDGGNISLLTPHGDLNVGLAASSTATKKPADLGIVAQRTGDVNIMAGFDVKVNQSKVFAMDGGDILVWSSFGSIDAGRGAKTALQAPPPIVKTNEDGTLSIEFPPALSGSGIRNFVTTANEDGSARKPGSVFLFAPNGFVDTGDAGIASAGDVFVGGELTGSGGLTAGGEVQGVAVPSTPSVSAGAVDAASNNAAAGKMAEQLVNLDEDSQQVDSPMLLTNLDLKVIGYGDEDCDDEEECLPN